MDHPLTSDWQGYASVPRNLREERLKTGKTFAAHSFRSADQSGEEFHPQFQGEAAAETLPEEIRPSSIVSGDAL
jgi:hypothetical protein